MKTKMKKYFKLFTILTLIAIALSAMAMTGKKAPSSNDFVAVDETAQIMPDYISVTIPFKNGPAIEIANSSGSIKIPAKQWEKLLENNKANLLEIDIYTQSANDKWNKFKTIENKISSEPVDKYLAYRNIPIVHTMWQKMGLYQRDLTNFKTAPIVENTSFKNGCVNCHNFYNQRADTMTIAVRSKHYGVSTILVRENQVHNLGVKFTYSTWHPNGNIIVFSANKVTQFFNAAQNEVRNVLDQDSMLAYYNLKERKVSTAVPFSRKDWLETYPAFSPDGKYVYFSAAKKLWADSDERMPEKYEQVKYDLFRVSYDVENDKWGQIETVLTSEQTGKSILEPRVSPDGRWLVFCMCDYGCFPVYRPSSDLYAIDLQKAQQTGQFELIELPINSSASESWHSFSSNSRWLAFSTKGMRERLTVTAFSHIDEDGNFSKPFVLPQKDPEFYDYFAKSFSLPEFSINKITVPARKIGSVITKANKIPIDLPITMATPGKGKQEAWEQRE